MVLQRHGIRLAVLCACAVILSGCSGADHPNKGAEVRDASAASTLVNGMTGRGAVRAGRQARETIETVSREKKQALDEVLE